MAPGRSRWLLLGLLQSVAWVPCLWGNQRWRRPSGFHATGDLEYFEVYSKDWRMTEAYGVVVVCVVMGIGADSPRVCRSWYRPIRIWHNLTAIENAKAWWITNHLKTTILDKLYTKRASISDMFGTGPTEFGRISSFSSCKNDLHKKDLLGSRRRLNDSWSHAVAETAAAVSAVTQLNCRFQPPSETISISPLFSPKWLDNSNSKSNKSTTRPPSFLYLIPQRGMVSFLEGENPTQRPAESVSLVGRWQLAFCGVNRGLKVLIGIQGSVENGRMLNFCLPV